MKQRMPDWWEHPLEHWSAALGFGFEVFEGAPGGHPRSLGEWWQADQQHWCLQLDVTHWLKLTGFAGDKRVQTALSWTLRTIYETTRKDWKQTSVERVTRLAGEDDEFFVKAWHDSASDTLNPALDIPPGYFVWIHFNETLAHDRPGVDHDLRTSIEAVVQAFFPDQVFGWTWTPRDAASLLVYCSIPVSLEQSGTDGETGMDPTPTRQVREQQWLRRCLSEMLDMLAADAMVLAKVSVGRRVSDVSQIEKGLISVVSAHRVRGRLAQSARITVWGEQPWIPVVQGLPAAALDQFVEVASVRADGGKLVLTNELLETLQGVIAANLNVSEAARLLYLHRNTLINRIERIRQQTGYDIRAFQDASVLWLVHMFRPTTT